MQNESSRQPSAVSYTETDESSAQPSILFLQGVHATKTYTENTIIGTFILILGIRWR